MFRKSFSFRGCAKGITLFVLALNFSSCQDNRIRVLVFDMPVVKARYPQVEISNLIEPLSLNDRECQYGLRELEDFLGKEGRYEGYEFLESFSKFAYASHGNHVLGLVMKGLEKEKRIRWAFQGMGLPPNHEELKEEGVYKERLQKELNAVRERIAQFRPQLVNVSGSETVEENKKNYLDAGFSEAVAQEKAMAIYKKWKELWGEVIKNNPQTLFVVSAGNGGVDGKGDLLETGGAVPASLEFPNLVSITSIGRQEKLSDFSNWGGRVHFALLGEGILSGSACPLHSVRLWGTSQSTALFSNLVIKNMLQGKSALDYANWKYQKFSKVKWGIPSAL